MIMKAIASDSRKKILPNSIIMVASLQSEDVFQEALHDLISVKFDIYRISINLKLYLVIAGDVDIHNLIDVNFNGLHDICGIW